MATIWQVYALVDATPTLGKELVVSVFSLENKEPVPQAPVIVRSKGSSAEDPGFTLQECPDGTQRTFCPSGDYIATCTMTGFGAEEKLIRIDPDFVSSISIGVTPDQNMPQKHARLMLTFGEIQGGVTPDLELQVVTAEGICNAENPTRGQVKIEYGSCGKGLVPQSINLKQPLSGKFKIQVANRNVEAHGSMLQLQPQVVLSNTKGAMEECTWRITDVFDKHGHNKVQNGTNVEVWHVATLSIEEHNKFDTDSVVPTNIGIVSVEASVPETQLSPQL
jgi:hypothetical protein